MIEFWVPRVGEVFEQAVSVETVTCLDNENLQLQGVETGSNFMGILIELEHCERYNDTLGITCMEKT